MSYAPASRRANRRNASRLWLIRDNGWNEMERKLISGQVRSRPASMTGVRPSASTSFHQRCLMTRKTMTNDIDKLTALNRDFVASAQNSDVRRFDEILAPDCSNPDKSLVDRAAFLEQTAKPVAIKNLQAHDVKIRIM